MTSSGGAVDALAAAFAWLAQQRVAVINVSLVGPDNAAVRAPAFGISFPYGDEHRTVKVVVNKVWIDQMLGSVSDNPDDEEDYDD